MQVLGGGVKRGAPEGGIITIKAASIRKEVTETTDRK